MTQASQDDDIPRERQREILERFFGMGDRAFEDWASAQPDGDRIGEFLLSMLQSGPLRERKNPDKLPGRE